MCKLEQLFKSLKYKAGIHVKAMAWLKKKTVDSAEGDG